MSMATESYKEFGDEFSTVTADPIDNLDDHISDRLLDLVQTVDQYYTPVICLFGIVGNSLSIIVFFSRTHKARGSLSSSVYLSALAISDTGFLVNLFILWLNNMGVDLLINNFMCKYVMYVGQVTGFLSVWFIVAFTIERTFAVCMPLSPYTRCTASRARKITTGLTIFAIVAFSYVSIIAQVIEIPPYHDKGGIENITTFQKEEMTWTNESLSTLSTSDSIGAGGAMQTETFPCNNPNKINTSFPLHGANKTECIWVNRNLSQVIIEDTDLEEARFVCSVPPEFMKVSEISNYIDSVFTFIIPFVLIFCLNLKIIFCVKRFKDHRDGMIASLKITKRNMPSHSCRTAYPTTATTMEAPKLKDFLTSNGKLKELPTNKNNSDSGFNSCGKCEDMLSCRVSRSLRRKRSSKSEKPAKYSVENDCQSPGSSGQITPPFKRMLTNHSTSAMEIRITKTLLLISSVFLLLHFPAHSIRIASFIQSFGGSEKTQRNLFIAQLWANILFNTNFAINFLLYCCSGKAFRHSVKNLLSWKPAYSSPMRSNTTTMTTQIHLNNTDVMTKRGSRCRQDICSKMREPEEEQV